MPKLNQGESGGYDPAPLSDLHDWAQALPPASVVGVARRVAACPLAAFYRERYGAERVGVGFVHTFIWPTIAGERHIERETQAVEVAIMARIDRAAPATPITREHFLAVLDDVALMGGAPSTT